MITWTRPATEPVYHLPVDDSCFTPEIHIGNSPPLYEHEIFTFGLREEYHENPAAGMSARDLQSSGDLISDLSESFEDDNNFRKYENSGVLGMMAVTDIDEYFEDNLSDHRPSHDSEENAASGHATSVSYRIKHTYV